MVDSHCHLQEIEESQWNSSDLTAMVCNSTGVSDSKKAIELSEKYKSVYAALGLGYSVEGDLDNKLNTIEELLSNQGVVGVGEIGLDYWDDMREETRARQRELFVKQIDMGKRHDLPVIVHNRNAADEILKILDYGKAVMHCFTGNEDFMRKCIERGWFVSFGGILTFKGSADLREVARMVPEEQLLVETDAPYIAPEPVRGTSNIPGNVKYVLQCLAEVRGEKADKMEKVTTENAARLFGIKI